MQPQPLDDVVSSPFLIVRSWMVMRPVPLWTSARSMLPASITIGWVPGPSTVRSGASEVNIAPVVSEIWLHASWLRSIVSVFCACCSRSRKLSGPLSLQFFTTRTLPVVADGATADGRTCTAPSRCAIADVCSPRARQMAKGSTCARGTPDNELVMVQSQRNRGARKSMRRICEERISAPDYAMPKLGGANQVRFDDPPPRRTDCSPRWPGKRRPIDLRWQDAVRGRRPVSLRTMPWYRDDAAFTSLRRRLRRVRPDLFASPDCPAT